MTYRTLAHLARDPHMIDRVTACAAVEGIASPQEWAYEHAWVLSATPGWDVAYASAITNEVENPGADESVISDAMILAAVQPAARSHD